MSDLISFLLDHHVLKFGQFTLKSGRISPYFFQLGELHSGHTLHQLGSFYAKKLMQAPFEFDGLWAAPYKGIPIATATAIALDQDYQHPTHVSSYRKEAKAHGEKGIRLGAPLTGRFVFIDDVMTAGTAFKEASIRFDQEKETDGELVGRILALDREEQRDEDQILPTLSLVTFTEILTYIQTQPEYAQHQKAMLNYRERFGIKACLPQS